VIVHIIFSTKNRDLGSYQTCDARSRLYSHICRDLGAELARVGGVADHVHMVTTLPRTVTQAQLIEQIKKTSSNGLSA